MNWERIDHTLFMSSILVIASHESASFFSAYELWFKQILVEIDSVRELFSALV